jgi:hypothetical protein
MLTQRKGEQYVIHSFSALNMISIYNTVDIIYTVLLYTSYIRGKSI